MTPPNSLSLLAPSSIDQVSFSNPDSNAALSVTMDGLVGGFREQATDGRTLAAVTAAGMAYRVGSLGAMSLRLFRGIPLVSRFAPVVMGLGTEVTAFEMTNRSLTSLSGDPASNPNLWSWNGEGGLRQGLLSSFITFGTLRGAGHLVRNENIVVQHLFQDSAMVLGHNASGVLGITQRPSESLAGQFLHAEATNLQMSGSMALGHRFTGERLLALERGLDLAAAIPGNGSQEGDFPPDLFEPPWAIALGRNFIPSRNLSEENRPGQENIWMSVRGGKGNPQTDRNLIFRSGFSTDHNEFDYFAMVLKAFGGMLPLTYLQLFSEARFGIRYPERIETNDKPLNPSFEFVVRDGIVLSDPSSSPRLDPHIERLMDIFWRDSDQNMEPSRRRVLLYPEGVFNWIEIAEKKQIEGREEEARLFLQQATLMNPQYVAQYLAIKEGETKLIHSCLRRIEGPKRRVTHALLKRRLDELEPLLDRYFERLHLLSDPPSHLTLSDWVDFPTNEDSYPKAFAGEGSIVDRGGVYIGTGTSLFLPHMVHQGASQGYVVDHNRLVTEGIIPAIGALLVSAKDPIEWLSHLYSVPLSRREQADLSREPITGLDRQSFMWKKGDPGMLDQLMSDLSALILPRVDPTIRAPLAENLFHFFTNFMKNEGGKRREVTRTFCEGQDQDRGGLLSSLETFKAAQQLWREGRITGISALWQGNVFSRISREVTENGDRVRVVYASNILEHHLSGGEKLRLFKAVSEIPFDDQTRVIHTQAGGRDFMMYSMTEYKKLMRGLHHESQDAEKVHALMAMMTESPQWLESLIKTKFPTLLSDPLIQAILSIAQDEMRMIHREKAQRVASRYALTPDDRWRFFFVLSQRKLLK